MSSSSAPLPLPAPAPDDLLQAVLDASPTAIQVLRPCCAEAGTDTAADPPGTVSALTGFCLAYLNGPARQQLGLPAGPLPTQLPLPLPPDLFNFYRRVFETGGADSYDLPSRQVPGPAPHVTARRSADLLVVSFPSAAEPVPPGRARPVAEAPGRALERRLLYQVFEQTPAAICLLRGPEHRYEYVNSTYQALFPGREFADRAVAAVLPETVPDGFVALLDQVYQTGQTFYGYELPFTPQLADGRPGQVMYFTFTYQALREDGQVVGVSTFAYDVTEQVRARRERAAQQRLRALFEQAPVAIGIFSVPDYVVEVYNSALQAMWGRPAGQVLHRPLFEELPESGDQGFRARFDEVVRTGQPHVAHEVPLRVWQHGQPAATALCVNFVYHPLRDPQGVITAVMVVATDVTEQVTARQQVQRLNEQLSYTNTELETFVYTASHDLLGPIANMQGLLRLLRNDLPKAALTPNAANLLLLLQESVNRFKRTIGHLAAVGRLQQQPGLLTTVRLADVVADVRLDLALLLVETGGQLDVDVDDCPPVRFSESNLRSIVYNLLTNALKYGYPGRPPVVRVRCYTTPEGWTLTVQDNGLGLDLREGLPMFGLFQRFHTHVEGSGVGLFMIKKMVENAGGRIGVQSELGVGTTFSVFFRT